MTDRPLCPVLRNDIRVDWPSDPWVEIELVGECPWLLTMLSFCRGGALGWVADDRENGTDSATVCRDR
jgi:hypothetical protein